MFSFLVITVTPFPCLVFSRLYNTFYVHEVCYLLFKSSAKIIISVSQNVLWSNRGRHDYGLFFAADDPAFATSGVVLRPLDMQGLEGVNIKKKKRTLASQKSSALDFWWLSPN